MPVSDDNLRGALRDLAEQAGPATFTAGPLVRRAARLRARFVTITACCGLAVAATAVAVPAAISTPAQPSISSAWLAHPRPWGTAFTCGQPLPSTLPGSATEGLRVAVGPVTKTASGAPAVTWYLKGTWVNSSGPYIGPITAAVLFARDGTVIAVQRAGQPSIEAIQPAILLPEPKRGDMQRYQPRFTTCAPGNWSTLWSHRQDYQVVIVATVWTAPKVTLSPRFLSVAERA